MASISKRGDSWRVRIVRKGYVPVVKSFPSKLEAQAFAVEIETAMKRGTYAVDPEETTTLADLLKRYKSEVTPAKRGAQVESFRIDAMLAPGNPASEILAMGVSTIKGVDVARWRDVRAKQVKASTLVKEWSLLAHCLKVARLDWGFTEMRDPFSGARKPVVRDARDRRLSEAELEAICEATQSHELATFLRLSVQTAARRGELRSLTWNDVDLAKAVAHFRITKNGTPRTIPLSPAAVALLKAMPRNISGSVFSMRAQGFSDSFKRACDRARRQYVAQGGTDPDFLVGLRLHDARHEACSRLAERGWSTLEVAAVSGHKTIALLSRYVHLKPEDLAVKMARG